MAMALLVGCASAGANVHDYDSESRSTAWVSSAPGDDNLFGSALAAGGNVLLVGAPGEDSDGHMGSVIIYRPVRGVRENPGEVFDNGYTEGVYLANPSGVDDGFGSAVTVTRDGTQVIIGAPLAEVNGNGITSGNVYMWDSSDGFGNHIQCPGSDTDSESRYGASVAIDEDIAVIGGPAASGKGAIWVFLRDGPWFEMARQELNMDEKDLFGHAVAVSGDMVLAGAPRATSGGVAEAGKAVLFKVDREARTLTFARELTDSEPSGLGYSVALSGDLAVVGKPYSPVANRGAVHVYERNHGGDDFWGQVFTADAHSRSGSNLLFGWSVDILGTTVLVGEPGGQGEQNGVQGRDAGLMHVYRRDDDEGKWWHVDQVHSPEEMAGARFGSAVAVGWSGIWGGAPFAERSDLSVASPGLLAGWELCGDGLHAEGEECDDANDIESDGCLSSCLRDAWCGDGFVTERVGETCEPGSDEDCRAVGTEGECTKCGDGVVQYGEDCDDGDLNDGGGCPSTCQYPETQQEPGSGGPKKDPWWMVWWQELVGAGLVSLACCCGMLFAVRGGSKAPNGLRPLPVAYERMLGHSDGFQLLPDSA